MSDASTRVTVALGERSYPVQIGPGELAHLGTYTQQRNLGRRALVVSNPAIAKAYGDTVQQALSAAGVEASLHLVPAGERAKRLSRVEQLCDAAIDAGLDRGSFVVALGGGVIGDLAGFAAAALYRGVDFVQLPTTLVAMVDSSVGGKTGVNSARGKNLIGAFWQPALVVADLDTLKTLPARELRCGMAEVIKHGLILDEAMFDRLEHELADEGGPGELTLTRRVGMDAALVRYCVERSCELKGQVVAEDERESSGRRAWLNYGHTFGHALEAVCGYGALHHGEAVAVGMVLAADLGVRRGDIDSSVRERTVRLLEAVGLPTRIPEGTDVDLVYDAMHRDKKVRDGKLRLTLLRRLGEAMVVGDTPSELVLEVLRAGMGREAEDAVR